MAIDPRNINTTPRYLIRSEDRHHIQRDTAPYNYSEPNQNRLGAMYIALALAAVFIGAIIAITAAGVILDGIRANPVRTVMIVLLGAALVWLWLPDFRAKLIRGLEEKFPENTEPKPTTQIEKTPVSHVDLTKVTVTPDGKILSDNQQQAKPPQQNNQQQRPQNQPNNQPKPENKPQERQQPAPSAPQQPKPAPQQPPATSNNSKFFQSGSTKIEVQQR